MTATDRILARLRTGTTVIEEFARDLVQIGRDDKAVVLEAKASALALAIRIVEEEAKRAPAAAPASDQLSDGRPMSADVFMARLLEQDIDVFDFRAAIEAWCYGDWSEATSYLEGTDGLTSVIPNAIQS